MEAPSRWVQLLSTNRDVTSVWVSTTILSTALLLTPRFEDVTTLSGINPVRFASGFLPSTAASAWSDVDNDGDIDLLLGGDEFGMQVLLNNGAPDWNFTDASSAFGVETLTGVIAIDILNFQGTKHMWITRYGSNGEAPELQLWSLPAGTSPIKRIRWLTPYLLTHGDIDGDGDHDLIASAAVDCVPFQQEIGGVYAWSQHFGNWEPKVDSSWPALGCLSVPAVSDYGGNGVPDVVFTSDYGPQHTPTSVLSPDGATDRSLPRVYGMGIGVGDVDGDMVSDYVFTNIRDDALWLSKGGWHRGSLPAGGSFGTNGLRVKWGASIFDADNDGSLDIYVAAGQLLSSALYANDAEQQSLLYSKGTEQGVSSGLASETRDTTVGLADFDQDGRLDLLVGSTTDWRLFRNVSDSGHYLQVAITDAPGTTAVATCDGVTIHAEYTGTRAGAQDEPLLHFGLGDCTSLVDIRVSWPWGAVTERMGLEIDQRVQLSQKAPVQIQPSVVRRGEDFRVTYHGTASDVVWNDNPLNELENNEWTSVFTASSSGEQRIILTVDGEELQYRPWLRTLDTEFVRYSIDPKPLRRGTEHTLIVESDASLGEVTVTTTGAMSEPTNIAAGRWVGRIVVPPDSDKVHVETFRENLPLGEGWSTTPVTPIDPKRSEVRVEKTPTGDARILLLPVDTLGGYYLFQPERVFATTDDGMTYPFVAAGLSEWIATVPWGGSVTVTVSGTELPPVNMDLLGSTRTPDGSKSQLFSLYERAQPDGQDIVTVAFRPLDSNGQPVSLQSEPQLVIQGLEWLDSAEPYCQAVPNAAECKANGPLGRWREESLDGTTVLVTRLRTIDGAATASVAFTNTPELSVNIDLYSSPRTTPSDKSTAVWDETTRWLRIQPRDALGHLVGSGVDITIETDPPSAAPTVYVGLGTYVRAGTFRKATITLATDAEPIRIEVVGSMPQAASTGCHVCGPHDDKSRHHRWPAYLLIFFIPWALTRSASGTSVTGEA